jgi:hypothetical protein
VLLLAGWAFGVWSTMIRGTVYEVTGTYVARPGPTTILVRHDALPALDMQPMAFMAVEAPSPDVLDRAALQAGDRVWLRVRQRAEGFLLVDLARAD